MREEAGKTLRWVGAGVAACWAVRGLVRRARSIDLRGKTALVTGGSRGLGLVLARELARQGARLVLVARDLDGLSRARDELAGRGAEVLARTCDVTDRRQVEEAVSAALDRFGAVEALINNAGTIARGAR
jgi:NAD(P)-dependent dehydrogenase (short-subunit alcohol dehydrogenase family)